MAKTTKQLDKDIQFLLDNPEKTLGSKYHDAASCWELIDALVERLRTTEEGLKDLLDDLITYDLESNS